MHATNPSPSYNSGAMQTVKIKAPFVTISQERFLLASLLLLFSEWDSFFSSSIQNSSLLTFSLLLFFLTSFSCTHSTHSSSLSGHRPHEQRRQIPNVHTILTCHSYTTVILNESQGQSHQYQAVELGVIYHHTKFERDWSKNV